MRLRNFITTLPFSIIPVRVASLTIPLRKMSESVFPCRSAVKIAMAFSSAERYKDTLNTPNACLPWRDSPFDFLGLAICLLPAFVPALYHKVCTHHKEKSNRSGVSTRFGDGVVPRFELMVEFETRELRPGTDTVREIFVVDRHGATTACDERERPQQSRFEKRRTEGR